jgi:hypothetical protein
MHDDTPLIKQLKNSARYIAASPPTKERILILSKLRFDRKSSNIDYNIIFADQSGFSRVN